MKGSRRHSRRLDSRITCRCCRIRCASHGDLALTFCAVQDLRLLAHGPEHVTASSIIGLLSFTNPQSTSSVRVRAHLETVLRGMLEDDLRKFLVFVTEIGHIPEGGLLNLNQLGAQGKIRVTVVLDAAGSAHRRPVAHTCFYELELPDYGTAELMETMLREGFDHMDGAGFQIA